MAERNEYLKRILIIGMLFVGAFLSCEKPIEGEAELIFYNANHAAYAPHWSSDGLVIYYVLGEYSIWPREGGSFWAFDLEKNTSVQISTQEIWDFDLSPSGDLIVTWKNFWFWIRNSETWELVDSLQPCAEALIHWDDITQPKYSFNSNDIIYYTYKRNPDSVILHRINQLNLTDEELLVVSGRNQVFAPGSGDTLIALNDTIYNLQTGERIPTGILPEELHWNPAATAELLICSRDNDNLYIFKIEKRKAFRIQVDNSEIYDILEARFSPDGKKIAFASSYWGDGYVENKLWIFERLD